LEVAAGHTRPAALAPHPSIRNQFIILSGERRYAAALRDGSPLIGEVIENWEQFLAWMILDARWPSSGALKMPLTDAVVMIDKITGALETTRFDNVDRTVSEYLGLSWGHVQETRQLARLLQSDLTAEQKAAIVQELRLVARGEASPSAAYQRTRKMLDRAAAPTTPGAVSRRVLNNSAVTAAGVIDGLRSLSSDFTEQLGAGECAEWARALGPVRAQLERTIKALKERAKQ
jgi:hypothetical protein